MSYTGLEGEKSSAGRAVETLGSDLSGDLEV